MSPLPAFRLHRPRSIEAVLDLLSEHGEVCRLIAGGTDLVVNLRHRVETPGRVVSLAAVDELRGVRELEDGALEIGALTTVAELSCHPRIREELPVLAGAADVVASPALRSMGTLGGNLCLDTRCHWINQSWEWRSACGFCLKKDGSVCHVARGSAVCVAPFSGDLAPALLTLGATVTLRSAAATRVVSLEAFYREDGTRPFDLARGELLVSTRIPAASRGRSGSYRKLRARGSIDYPVAGAAVSGRTRDGRFRGVHIAVTAVAPRPQVIHAAGELLEGAPTSEETIERAVDVVRRSCNPLHTSGHFAPWYRRHRLGLFVRDGLRELAGRVEPSADPTS